MKNPYEIRYFDIGSPVFVERPEWSVQFKALRLFVFLAVAFAVSFAVNAWFESLCPNGGTMLLAEGIACAL